MSTPGWFGRLARSVYYPLYRAQLRGRCAWADLQEPPNRGEVPLPPAMLRFRVSELIAASEFRRVGRGVAEIIDRAIGGAGMPLSPGDRVLDFGCGCGRTLPWLMKAHAGVEFHGTDVDAEAIAWCSAHIPAARFGVNGAAPPLRYPDSYFDAVYCLSVFTHLDEAAQDAWLAELHRVIKADGVLVFSMHGENAAAGLSAADKAELAASGFLHRRSKKLNGIVPDWYQTTWHSKEYIVVRVGRWFEEVAHSATPGHLQDLVTARRPRRG